ncbi:hypothetical protein [Polaribacter sp.]
MKIALLIIGLILIYGIIRIGFWLNVVCENQVKQAKLLQQLIDKQSK